MKTLLRIDSSLRREGSYSRTVGDYFVSRWKEKHPAGKVIVRDLEDQPVPHLTLPVVEAFFGSNPKPETSILSDQLVVEIKTCSEILITCPMYNFHVPSTLKAYIDHVVRANETFKFSEGKYEGLLMNKKAFLITAMGGKRLLSHSSEGFENYLQNILGFMGIKDTATISIDGTSDDAYASKALVDAKNLIYTLIN